jgi:hypothetical protein
MRPTSLFLAVIVAAALLLGAASYRQPATMPLGTVVYSVLDRDAFLQANGPGWELLDGSETSIDSTALCREAHFCTLPDARGVFIRGMNLGRSVDSGDPQNQRAVGSFQADAYKQHIHRLRNELDEAGYDNHGNGERARILVDDGHPFNGTVWPTYTTGGAGADVETRPRNIALYTYIRVER